MRSSATAPEGVAALPAPAARSLVPSDGEEGARSPPGSLLRNALPAQPEASPGCRSRLRSPGRCCRCCRCSSAFPATAGTEAGRGRAGKPPAVPAGARAPLSPAASAEPGRYMEKSSLLQLIQEQLDPENTGFIGVETFASLVHSHELPLDPAKLEMLVALAQSNDEGQICYQELVDLISSKRSSSFKRAIANGQRALPRDGLLDETGLGFYKRFVRYVAYEILPREMDRRWYFYQHRTCPPPVFMAVVTLTQIIVFLCYGARLNKWVLQTYHPEYMKSPLVYHPGHRARAWRFFTYMFMHVG
ncbi:hypothetical protein lerEdw1_002300 [Lerista edwardsae]|nr:hypothetical protein lerEdw1_002300 [Lerista edwardsae]